ncbi:ATP-binding protein [Streptomyces hydrogenans]|uniref:ATP-binding protein n=1 Tax=Streptomyces hydrogenans TaxID=1873719 RepID=UPI00331D9FE2
MNRILPLPHAPEAHAAVRHRAQSILSEWGLPRDSTDEALLVISELASNALAHARPPALLHLSLESASGRPVLVIEVSDGGPSPTPTKAVHPEEHGRGLAIIAALAARHGNRRHPGGATWWAALELADESTTRTHPSPATAVLAR